MNWEDRLRDTFSNERAAMEARPKPTEHRTPGALRTERTWFSPGLLLAGLGLLCLIVLGAGAYLQNDDPAENVTATGGDDPTETPIVTPTPITTATAQTTATPTEGSPAAATATTRASALPTVTATTRASALPTVTPGVIPTATPGCDVPYAIAKVVDVAADDPDGGLVVHTEPGVDTPVVGVLAHDADGLLVTPTCAITTDGALWLEVGRPPIAAEGALMGWVNARYLAADTVKQGAFYQIFFPTGQGEPDADGNITWTAPVERPVGTADGRPTGQEALELLFAGPTEAEQSAGFSALGNPGTFDPPDGSCASPAEVAVTNEGTVARVQLCVDIATAGVGDDARHIEAITNTVALASGADTVVILDRNGRCLGDLSDAGDRCLADLDELDDLDGGLDAAWCDRGAGLGNDPVTTDPPAQDEKLADHVASISALDVGPCTLVVIEMDDLTPDGRRVDLPPVIVDAAGRTGIRLQFPESVDVGNGPAATAQWPSGAAALTMSNDGVGIWIGADQIGDARVSGSAAPPRLIVAIPKVAAYPVAASFTELDGYYLFPITQTGPGAPVLFEGVGAAFEASGVLVIRQNGTVIEQQPFRTGNPGVAFRDFGVDLNLDPGEYEVALVACDQCDDELTWLPFTVE